MFKRVRRGIYPAARGMGALAAVIALPACQAAAPVPDSSASANIGAPAPAARNEAAPVAPAASHPDARTAQWLAGGWAVISANCEVAAAAYYDATGRFGAFGQEGSWKIEGGRLVVTITHEAVGDPEAMEYIGLPEPETRRLPLTRDGDHRLTLVVDGRPVRMMRCPAARPNFAT